MISDGSLQSDWFYMLACAGRKRGGRVIVEDADAETELVTRFIAESGDFLRSTFAFVCRPLQAAGPVVHCLIW